MEGANYKWEGDDFYETYYGDQCTPGTSGCYGFKSVSFELLTITCLDASKLITLRAHIFWIHRYHRIAMIAHTHIAYTVIIIGHLPHHHLIMLLALTMIMITSMIVLQPQLLVVEPPTVVPAVSSMTIYAAPVSTLHPLLLLLPLPHQVQLPVWQEF
jgi:hypothetical protein